MRTSALLVVLWAAQAFAAPVAETMASEPSRLELGLPAEVTLVGLTAGVRPELLVRVGGPEARSRLRLAVGLLAGPDQLLMPLSFGYRAVFRQGLTVQPLLGLGVEAQFRFVADLAPVRSLGVYLEAGVAAVLTEHWSLAVMLTTDVMFLGSPGFGFGPRVLVSYRLPGTPW